MTCMYPEDNMVKKLRGEDQKSLNSVVSGVFATVVTSFIKQGNKRQQRSLPMTSIAFSEDEASCHAIPLTIEILQAAIPFLNGNSADQVTNNFTTVCEGLCTYLKLLAEKVKGHECF
jgi:hypothetical protein